MNGKKAKMLRRAGKVAKKTKKQYNTLSHGERGLLGDIYRFNEERKAYSEK